MMLTRSSPSRTRARTCHVFPFPWAPRGSLRQHHQGEERLLCLRQRISAQVARSATSASGSRACWRRSPPIQAPREHLSLDQNRPLRREEACRSTTIAPSPGKRPVDPSQSCPRSGRCDRRLATNVFAENRRLSGREKGAMSDQERLSGRARGPRSVRDRLSDDATGSSGELAQIRKRVAQTVAARSAPRIRFEP